MREIKRMLLKQEKFALGQVTQVSAKLLQLLGGAATAWAVWTRVLEAPCFEN